jgi:GrpB-like predicted nucleotidyltransferase (UPF0157 family)
MIKIVPYDRVWPREYELEAAALRGVLGARARRVEHVGSTAVPGLAAKPVIDIQVSVGTLVTIEPYREALASLGYGFFSVGEFDHIYPFFAKPREWPSTHHVHLCVAGGEQEAKHVAFRDYLRSHQDQAAAYAALKYGLAAEHHGTTFASRENYSLAKTEFVESALASAGFAWREPQGASHQDDT